MGAVDRTLLASLGFLDRDKKSPLHDLGCQYVAQPEVFDSMGLRDRADDDETIVFDRSKRAQFEQVISKGEGKYKTTIGFVDVTIPVLFGKSEGRVLVEVKIESVGLGDILRQINLYREYDHSSWDVSPPWILAAAFEMSTAFVEGLRSHNICPVHLGERFRTWAAGPKTPSDVRSI